MSPSRSLQLLARSVATATWAAAWLALAGLLALGTLATGVAFIAWLYRARRNLDLESTPIAPPRWSPKWVLLAWLVPGGNLVLPAAVVTDVARASAGPRAVRLAWAWWASLLGSLLLAGWTLLRPTPEAEPGLGLFGYTSATVPSPERAAMVDAFLRHSYWLESLQIAALLVLTAVLGTRLVRVVTAAQRSRLDRGVSAG